MRTILIIFSLIFFLYGLDVKKELTKTKIVISKMNEKMDKLAKEISRKETSLNYLQKKIKKLSFEIQNLQKQLKNSNQIINELKDLQKGYKKQLEEIQNEINDFLSTNYYLDSQTINNINDLIYNEITKQALEEYSKKIEKLISKKEKLQEEIKSTDNKIQKIISKQKLLESKKQELKATLNKRKKELLALKRKKEEYKKKLLAMINKQKVLQNKLEKLSIIKKRKKAYKPATFTYRGMKTIAPLRGKVIKKFESYIDPIYKIRIYNDSITIKPYQKNAIVRSIMSGKVVYIGESGGKKIIVIKHKGNIFSIYANLSKISPLIKKGSYVKRGQIIARVEDNLEFEVTYKEKPINPLKVIRLK
jgi:murein DD-endopeptidase MepM/ murein hydrolase activator NlpD